MYRAGSSSEFDDFSTYRCPKCTRSFSSLRNLRDHIDIVHLYKPTRDTDDDEAESCTYSSPLLDGLSGSPGRRHGDLLRETLEIERQLRLAKELELRHKILHRHTKSEDELRQLNDEIARAKQRQYDMCKIIHNAKEEIEQLRQSAEKISADQQLVIDRLRQELKEKDKQLEASTGELQALLALRHQLQEDFHSLTEEREQHRCRLEEIYNELRQKEQLIADKQREVESLQVFIKEASKKELAARKKLENFINGLLDRAERAEEQVRRLTKQLAVQGVNPGAMYKSFSDNQLDQRPDIVTGSRRNIRSQSAEPLMTEPVHRTPVSRLSSCPPAPAYIPQPQSVYSPTPEGSGRTSSRSTSRKLPSDPLLRDYYAYPVHSTSSMGSGSGGPGYEKSARPKWVTPEGRTAASRCDMDRPESGYGSVHHGSSRPQSRLSSVSEHSTDTVVAASEYQGESSRNARSPTGSSVLDADDEVFELNLDRKLPVDDNGILWHDGEGDSRSSKPRLSNKSSSDSRPTRSSWMPSVKCGKEQLPISRMSSVNSVERDILNDINHETKLEMQRYKFLLRDRLRVLKEQEKYMDRADADDVIDDDDAGTQSDSDLTSVTSNESMTSVTFTSFSEFSDDERSGRKWKRSKVKMPLVRKGNVKRLVAEKPKPISIVPQTSAKPMTITPPSGAKTKQLRVSPASAFHNPSVTTTAKQRQQQQQQQLQQQEKDLDPATLQRHALLYLIFSYLDTRTLSSISIVCREWRDISRHPSLWRKVVLSNSRISSKFLHTLSQWCCTIQILVLEELRARSKKPYESIDEYKKKTRGSLEPGLDDLLKASQKTLISIRIVDCGNILTDRCLWLASCYCHQLQRITYVSNTDPLGSEVIWSLGAGCREISKLIVPPLYPNERGDRFTNRCLQMISWCWPEIRVLAVGGKHISKKGLLEIARNCSHLQVLELHQMVKVTDEVALAMCGAGLQHLEMLAIIFTQVSPSVIKIFVDSCPRLKSLKIRIAISDYYSDTEKADNKRAFAAKVKELENLKKTEAIAKVLTLQVVK